MKTDLKTKILDVMNGAPDMAIATIRDDGFPQNTTVTFVNDGLTVYFVCAADSQKARNLGRDGRVSVTMTLPYDSWHQIRGLSMAALARRVTDVDEMKQVGAMVVDRYPEAAAFANENLDNLSMFELVPEVVSLLDYTVAFGHTDQVIVSAGDIARTRVEEPHIWLPKSA